MKFVAFGCDPGTGVALAEDSTWHIKGAEKRLMHYIGSAQEEVVRVAQDMHANYPDAEIWAGLMDAPELLYPGNPRTLLIHRSPWWKFWHR